MCMRARQPCNPSCGCRGKCGNYYNPKTPPLPNPFDANILSEENLLDDNFTDLDEDDFDFVEDEVVMLDVEEDFVDFAFLCI